MTRTYPITCRSCNGVGTDLCMLTNKPCPACHGTGVVTATETLPDPPQQQWPGWPTPYIGDIWPTTSCDNPKPEPSTHDFKNPMVSQGGAQ